MSGIFSPAQSAACDAFQNASDCFSQSAAGALLSSCGALFPPARIEPSLYLRTSSGVTAEISPWIVCPTFSATLMRLRMRSIRASITGSRATRLWIEGQWTGAFAAGAASAAPASNSASTPADPTPHIFVPLMSLTQRYVIALSFDKTHQLEGTGMRVIKGAFAFFIALAAFAAAPVSAAPPAASLQASDQ